MALSHSSTSTSSRRAGTRTEAQWAFALTESMVTLSSRDQDFAASLLSQLDRHGGLTDKQWPYVVSLGKRALDRSPTAVLAHVACYASANY